MKLSTRFWIAVYIVIGTILQRYAILAFELWFLYDHNQVTDYLDQPYSIFRFVLGTMVLIADVIAVIATLINNFHVIEKAIQRFNNWLDKSDS